MQFFLFILANAMLFIRPSELVPGMGDVELYRYVIVACLLVSVPVVLQQVLLRCPGVPPVAGCVIALLPIVVLSHVGNGNPEEAWDQGVEFFKVLVYFLLLLGLVSTTARLRQFLGWLAVLCAAMAVIAILRYHADLAGPPPAPTTTARNTDGKNKAIHGTSVKDTAIDPTTGQVIDVNRMCGTGIFNDPNDLALVLITAIPLCLYWATDPKRRATRPLWIGLILLFGYALMLTHSRGGFLALLGGLVVFLQTRFGGRKTLGLALMVLPLLFVVFAGRMTSISASDGTGQSRIQLWSDGLTYFQQSPLFGIGMDGYHNVSNHVAHNSYIHCYVELGIVGGTLFLGAFYFALHGMWRLRPGAAREPSPGEAYNDPAAPPPGADAELLRLYPYVLAMLVTYAVGISFLSRSYIVPTYLLLGLAVIYMRLRAQSQPAEPPPTAGLCRLAPARLAALSACFLAASYTFVRLMVHW